MPSLLPLSLLGEGPLGVGEGPSISLLAAESVILSKGLPLDRMIAGGGDTMAVAVSMVGGWGGMADEMEEGGAEGAEGAGAEERPAKRARGAHDAVAAVD